MTDQETIEAARELGANIFIHTPTYNGHIAVETMFGIVNSIFRLGVQVTMATEMGPLIARTRDAITTKFAECPNWTHMLCIDADVVFDVVDVAKLLLANKAIVAGCYPRKNAKQDVPAKPYPEPPEGELRRCAYAPAGFMLIRRDAVMKMAEQVTRSYFVDQKIMLPLWQTHPGAFAGEDVSFCRRAREAGLDVWLHTGVRLKHYGMHYYEFPSDELEFADVGFPDDGVYNELVHTDEI